MSLVDGQHPQMDGNMITVMNQQKTGGSDSVSPVGSPVEISPSETPTLIVNNSSMKLSEQQQKQQQQVTQKQQQINYNKQINIARINGRSDKLLPISVGSNTPTAALMYPPATSPQQHYIGSDIILTSGPNILQTSLTNNNSMNQVGSAGNEGGPTVVCSGGISVNNNLGNTVLMTSPSAINPVSGGVINNVMTSNSVILPPTQHQQYSAAHPYQHIASTTRPAIISHSHGIAGPSPHGTFRMPSFQIPSNGEIIYPYATGITMFPVSGTAPPPAPVAAVRSSPSTSVPPLVTSNVIQLPQPPPPQQQQSQQQQQQSVLPQVQTNPPPPSAALLTASPYTSLTVGVSKQMSCYNCGSQTHTGRDCNEASMEDVTRGAIYKLDYSVSTSVSPTGPQQNTGDSLTGSNCSSCNQTSNEIGTESSSPTASTSSSSSLSNSNANPK